MRPSAPLATNTLPPSIATCCGGAPAASRARGRRVRRSWIATRWVVPDVTQRPAPSADTTTSCARSTGVNVRTRRGCCGSVASITATAAAFEPSAANRVRPSGVMVRCRASAPTCTDAAMRPRARSIDDELAARGIGHVGVAPGRLRRGVARLAEPLDLVPDAQARNVDQRQHPPVRVADERDRPRADRLDAARPRGGADVLAHVAGREVEHHDARLVVGRCQDERPGEVAAARTRERWSGDGERACGGELEERATVHASSYAGGPPAGPCSSRRKASASARELDRLTRSGLGQRHPLAHLAAAGLEGDASSCRDELGAAIGGQLQGDAVAPREHHEDLAVRAQAVRAEEPALVDVGLAEQLHDDRRVQLLGGTRVRVRHVLLHTMDR